MQAEKLTPNQFNDLINHKSGLLGISETTADMKTLIKNKHTDARAADAFNLFCYQAKKYIGAYAAVLGGLDTLIFSGGIGELSPEVRSEVCSGLDFLGIVLDGTKNDHNNTVISTRKSKARVYVIQTNEQLVIADMVRNVLGHPAKN